MEKPLGFLAHQCTPLYIPLISFYIFSFPPTSGESRKAGIVPVPSSLSLWELCMAACGPVQNDLRSSSFVGLDYGSCEIASAGQFASAFRALS